MHGRRRDNINNACSKLELIITDAADSCLKRPKLKKVKGKVSHTKNGMTVI
jgi:hypothetical protein